MKKVLPLLAAGRARLATFADPGIMAIPSGAHDFGSHEHVIDVARIRASRAPYTGLEALSVACI